jgi:Fe-S oxidoreductase
MEKCRYASGVTHSSSSKSDTVAVQTFEAALDARAQAMADACTRCGKCVEVCPVTAPGGLSAEELKNPAAVIGGVIDIVRTRQVRPDDGNDAARKWANACILSGECIKACDYGVNPRFLLYMARVKMARAAEPAVARKNGVDGFRKVAREVTQLSRIQLDDALLARLGQGAKDQGDAPASRQEPPATCSRRRTSRCWRSISWTRSASPMT